MTQKYHEQVEGLKRRVLEMGELAKRNVVEGVDAFAALDIDAADRVVRYNRELNLIDVEIEAAAFDLIALNQPVAKDARVISSCLKIISYLDRVGRLGLDCARATEMVVDKGHVKRLVSIPLMRDKAVELVTLALEAFRDGDVEKARRIGPLDDDIDGLYDEIFRECVTYMIEDPRTITACTQYMMVARNMERVGDNAGKIAEKTIFLVTGERRIPDDKLGRHAD